MGIAVLVAEDEFTLRREIVSRLSAAGFNVFEAAIPAHVGDVADSVRLDCAIVDIESFSVDRSFNGAVARHLAGKVPTIRMSSERFALGALPDAVQGEANMLKPGGREQREKWLRDLPGVLSHFSRSH